jgi:hypothetical protein
MGIEEVINQYFDRADNLCNEVRDIIKEFKTSKSLTKEEIEKLKAKTESNFYILILRSF